MTNMFYDEGNSVDQELMRIKLNRLSVAELRVLHVHFYKSKPLALELRKLSLVEDLIDPIMCRPEWS